MSEGMVHGAIAQARSGTRPAMRTAAPKATPTKATPTVAAVKAALAEVADPEIPVVFIVDLGMVEDVIVGPKGISVTLLPTFIGCPALDVIRSDAEHRLASFDVPVEVVFEYRVPWTSDRITPAGREKLRSSGFAPPTPTQPGAELLVQLGTPVTCPNCGSRRTVLENAFGPTRCRAIYHCTACRQPFETFKVV